MITPTLNPASQPPYPPIHRISVRQYEQMIDAGVFLEGPKLELIEGMLVSKMTQNPPHNFCVGEFMDFLQESIPDSWHLQVQSALAVLNSRPEPDLAVLPFPRRDLGLRHPRGDETALVVEVADTSLEYDRGVKARLYAAGRVPVYVIVNLPERTVEIYTHPDGAGETAHYRALRTVGETERFALQLAGHDFPEILTRDLFP
jgi:hypothetical protein